ncbi:MAG: hypothetical protein WCT46_06730 [Candidatus Gracilibacteria bacterium]|jgi:hypothetical protein
MSNAIARERLKNELQEETRKILIIAISHLLKECGFEFKDIAMGLEIHQELELTPAEIFDLSLEAQGTEATSNDLHSEIQEILRGIRKHIQDSMRTGLLSQKTISRISSEIASSITAIIGLVSRKDLESSPLRDEIYALTVISSAQAIWTTTTNETLRALTSEKKKKRKEKTPRTKEKRLDRRKTAREEQRGIAKARREQNKPKKIPARNGCTDKKSYKD